MEKILDNRYYDLIIHNSMVPSFDSGNNITVLNETHSLLHIQKSSMDPCDLGRQPYDSFPSLFTLSSKVSMERSGISNIQRVPQLGLFGSGIIIGVVDTGIDYLHQAFRNQDGTTRILSIWDQTEGSGRPPNDFTFGSEYGENHINTALRSENPLSIVPTTDPYVHGTAITSVIAGSPNQQHFFTGVVPRSRLVVVKLKEAKKNLKDVFFVSENALCYQESDVMLGIRYLISVARRLSRPIVICIALGSSQGGHDGNSPLSIYLNHLTAMHKTNAVVASGNEGNRGRHYFHNCIEDPFEHSFDLNAGQYDKKFFMEIWPFPPGRISIQISSPSGETIGTISRPASDCGKFTFSRSKTVVWINNILLEGDSGDHLILVRFDNPVPGVWNFRLKNMESSPFSFHCWLPSGDMISNETYFSLSDPDTTITAPGNARLPLTVTAYNQFDDTILEESGRGYTRSNQIAPDITAPGYRIPCAIPGNEYGTITGTGAAAAHGSGAAAMVVEWGFCKGNLTTLTGNQVNRMIIRGAQRSHELVYPNNIWGYGILDLYELFKRITVF